MTETEMLFWGGTVAIPAIISGAISWGYVKGKLYNYVTYGAHQKMCHDKSKENNVVLSEIRTDIKDLIKAIGRIEGRID